jgi:hypothetical protein
VWEINMKKTNALRKQVAALEKLAGLVEVKEKDARRVNGGRKRHHKTKTSNSVTLALGSGAVMVRRGSGHMLINGGSGALVAWGTGS